MRVLLLHPPDDKRSIAPGRFEPLGLETIAATIPRHEVNIMDLRIENSQTLIRHIHEFKPKVIGMSVNNSIHSFEALRLLPEIRELAPYAEIIVGGHHVTMVPEDFRKPCVDKIFHGWAEKSFPQYMEALENHTGFEHIPGIEVLKLGSTLLLNKPAWDLTPQDIPQPRRDLVARYKHKYRSDMGFRTSLVNTTRGCGNRCRFCSVWRASSGHVLKRDPEEVFREIASLPRDIEYVFFADDNTFIDTENSWNLARLIERSRVKKRYSGYCRSDTVTKNVELMRLWKSIGLNNLCVGFEVVDDYRLEALNKKNNKANNEEAAKILNELGIPFRPHFLVDPSFEKKDFQKIKQYVRKNNLLSPIFPINTPVPGSDNYDNMKDKIYLDYAFFDFAHAVVPTKLQLKEFYWSWMNLYFKGYPVIKNLGRFLLRRFAILTGSSELEKKNRHLHLHHLLRLRVAALFIILKVILHYRWVRKTLPETYHPVPGDFKNASEKVKVIDRAF